MLRVNHLIIGTTDLSSSRHFYCQVFSFSSVGAFGDTGSGKQGEILRLVDKTRTEILDLLLVPFSLERLPSPQHLAFEVDPKEFETIFSNANRLGHKIRSQPARNSPEDVPGLLDVGGVRFRNFYLLDPAGVNVEVMSRDDG